MCESRVRPWSFKLLVVTKKVRLKTVFKVFVEGLLWLALLHSIPELKYQENKGGVWKDRLDRMSSAGKSDQFKDQ